MASRKISLAVILLFIAAILADIMAKSFLSAVVMWSVSGGAKRECALLAGQMHIQASYILFVLAVAGHGILLSRQDKTHRLLITILVLFFILMQFVFV